MCLCFCFVWACGFCPSFLCATCSCQFVLTPPILLPVYWLIFPSCFPSLPSSFAPFIISLCLQFRVGSLPNVRCCLCPALSSPALPSPAQPCPALPSLVQPSPALPSPAQPASLFFPYGVIFVRLFSFFVNKKPFNLLQLGPRLIHSLNPDTLLFTGLKSVNILRFTDNEPVMWDVWMCSHKDMGVCRIAKHRGGSVTC